MDLMLSLDRQAPRSLRDQLYGELRQALQLGRLQVGDRVPPSRRLATELGVSRLTVEDAYARLIAEGMLAGRHGAGTYVTPEAAALALGPAPTTAASRRDAMPAAVPTSARRPLARWAARLPTMPVAQAGLTDGSPAELAAGSPAPIAFRSGWPDRDAFPQALWSRLLSQAVRDTTFDGFYGPVNGLVALRAAIAGYLHRSRQLPHPDSRIVITSGFQQGVDLLTRLVIDPGDVVAVEEPGYPGAKVAFTAAGARLAPIPVDDDGIRVDLLSSLAPGAKLVYVTPSHQYPTGRILSLARRGALLAWARETGALILEDDYDAEFRYGARPVPALAGLAPDAADHVAYLGTFSKVLLPSLRLGYVALPADLVDPFIAAKRVADYYSPTLEQAALAAFIAGGHFERHLIRMRRLYAARRELTLATLDRHFGGVATWDASAAMGLHLLLTFTGGLSEADVWRRAAAVGVGLDSAASAYLGRPPAPQAILGYAGLPDDAIITGLTRLGGAFR